METSELILPLLNYGVLGIWTVYNIYTIRYYQQQLQDLRVAMRKKDEDREAQWARREDHLIEVIEKNTSAINIALVRVGQR